MLSVKSSADDDDYDVRDFFVLILLINFPSLRSISRATIFHLKFGRSFHSTKF